LGNFKGIVYFLFIDYVRYVVRKWSYLADGLLWTAW